MVGGGSWRQESFWALMVWVLQCYVDADRREAQQEANRTKMGNDVCYLSWGSSDIARHQSSKIQMNTEASMWLCPHLCTSHFYGIC